MLQTLLKTIWEQSEHELAALLLAALWVILRAVGVVKRSINGKSIIVHIGRSQVIEGVTVRHLTPQEKGKILVTKG